MAISTSIIFQYPRSIYLKETTFSKNDLGRNRIRSMRKKYAFSYDAGSSQGSVICISSPYATRDNCLKLVAYRNLPEKTAYFFETFNDF